MITNIWNYHCLTVSQMYHNAQCNVWIQLLSTYCTIASTTVSYLHGQLAGHHGGDDDDALQQQLVRGPLLLAQPLLQHVARGEQREHEQQQQCQASLRRIAWPEMRQSS